MSRFAAGRRSTESEGHTFVVLPENQLAFSAAMRLAPSSPTRLYPLVTIYGPSGTGKTQLASHVVRELRAQDGRRQTIEVTAAEFASEWAEAARSRQLVEMHDTYTTQDVLVCEDLEGFRGRPGAQESFLTVLDELLARGGRALLTASEAPNSIRGLSPRLVSRCHGGICMVIGLPGRNSRLKLLKHFASQQQVPIASDALDLLAGNEGISPRELRGLVRRLSQAAAMQRCAADAALLRRLIDGEPIRSHASVADVAREVARQFGVTLRELRSQSRAAPTRIPRQAAMFLTRQLTQAPYSEIGRYFDGRRHSTVVYACEQFERQIATDSRLAAVTENIRAILLTGSRNRRKPVGKRRAARRECG